MSPTRNRNKKGFAAVETVAVLSTVALLLTIGFSVYHGARKAARIALAENNLKQVSTAMELYFRKYGSYPPPGSDLTVALRPFVEDPAVFANPLKEETTPGETINQFYRSPSLDEIDTPDHFLLAMADDEGKVAVVLETGNKITIRHDLFFNPLSAGTTVTYVVVKDGNDVIKFESMTKCLGEDGAQETDSFVIKVVGAGEKVIVTTKAGSNNKNDPSSGTATSTILLTMPGYTVLDSNGFKTEFVGKDGDVYTFNVTSVSNVHALSYIEFKFPSAEEIQVVGSEYETDRTSP